MRKAFIFFGSVAFAFISALPMRGQCVPDPGCVDINEPGQICPLELPDGVVGVNYEEVITILPPASTIYNQQTIPITYIVVDSVKNLPSGINYQTYNDKYYPDTAYCIDVYGTPSEVGVDTLAIYVSVYITIGKPVKVAQVVNDTSLIIEVKAGTGFNLYKTKEFKVFNASPNPFYEKIKLGCYIPYDGEVELKVYNILGEEIYRELMLGMHGENYFEFTGEKLNHGAYFYGITYQSGWYTGKFIKMK